MVKLGRSFGWLWSSFVASTVGTWLGFGAFPLIAIEVLHAGPAAVAALPAASMAAGALLALPLGPWIEAHRKKRIMMAADLLRCAALLSIPAGYALGRLTYLQLLVVSVTGAVANIAFTSAGGAFLRRLVRPDQLLIANGRFESASWTAIAISPPLGGAAFGLLGPMATVGANAAGFLLSALGIGAIRESEPPPVRTGTRFRAAELTEGLRFIHADPGLRALFRNTVAVDALILATEPLLAVLLLHDLGWPAWQYGLAFGLPCAGGFAGARIAAGLRARHGSRRVLIVAGALRALWPVALFFVMPGPGGVVFVIAVQLGLITCIGVFNPVFATERLRRVPAGRTGRVLVAWTACTTGAIAVLTAGWGLVAAQIGPRPAIGLAGLLLLATPALLPYRDRAGRYLGSGRGTSSRITNRQEPV